MVRGGKALDIASAATRCLDDDEKGMRARDITPIMDRSIS